VQTARNVPIANPTHAVASLRVAVGIATAGRPQILQHMLIELAKQQRWPDAIIVCASCNDDIGDVATDFPGVVTLFADRGLASKRNAILNHSTGFDVLIFLDDDFIVEPNYVAATEAAFASDDAIAVTTGEVIADGVCGPGLDIAAARLALKAADANARKAPHDVYSAYGCNMSLRLDVTRKHQLKFDEQLPLYGWLEDVDFSRRVAAYGRLVKVPSARGVHLGVKSGRQRGVQLGYSQVANPVYLMRKGTYGARRATALMTRNILANFGRAFWPEVDVDRAGRALGNLRAMLDLLDGRLHPGRILSL
jgi:GT2 family glycosyltransferase